MRIRLLVKLADVVEGVDLRHCREGHVLELPVRDADLLIKGGWAERTPPTHHVRSGVTTATRTPSPLT